MKKLLLFSIALTFSSQIVKAQVGTNFDEPAGATLDYRDTGDVYLPHQLVNNPYEGTVNHAYSGGELGFNTMFTPTRTGAGGSQGLTDGDTVGVYDEFTVVNRTDVSAWTTGNAYVIEDTDGMLTITFDTVDLTGTTNPRFQMLFWQDSTTWEFTEDANDRVYIRLDVDNGASIINILDSDGGGSGGSGISGMDLDLLTYNGVPCEYALTNIDVDLTPYIGSAVQLVIEADFNSTVERVIIDEILFTQGNNVLGVSENKILEKQLQVYPNPNSGMFTLNYTGNATLEQLSVFDVTGKLIKSETLKGFDKKQSFDFTNLAKGMYFIKVQTANTLVSKRVIIE